MINISLFESKYDKRIGEHASVSTLLSARGSKETAYQDADLAAIRQNFIDLMYYRCRGSEDCIKWLDENLVELPEITNDLSSLTEPQWIAIPGMYGGFSYGLIERDGKPLLVADSWVRIVGGSGQSHEITSSGITIVAEGYV